MPVNYDASTKSARMAATVAQIDLAASAGTLEIGTANMGTVLYVVTLNDPCGTVSGDTITFSGFPKTATAVATGTAASARIKDGDGNIRADGMTVGTTGADVNVSDVEVVTGQIANVTAMTLRHAL